MHAALHLSDSKRRATVALRKAGSQTQAAEQALRQRILSGDLGAGTRLSEPVLAEQLGISRTPIRAALATLDAEGLLMSLSSGGYAVRTFSQRDIHDAIEVRGALEGLAARLAAERGISAETQAELESCLDEIDHLIAHHGPLQEELPEFERLNARFHQLLHTLPGTSLMQQQIEKACSLPFASPSAFMLTGTREAESWHRLIIAQNQHRLIVQAIVNREGSRAESLAKEHARIAFISMQKLLIDDDCRFSRFPGAQLIHRPAKSGDASTDQP